MWKSRHPPLEVSNHRVHYKDKIFCNAIESLWCDYCEEEVFVELFNPKEFFEKEDPDYTLEEVNIVFDKIKFEPLDLQAKGDEKNKPSIEEPQELESKSLLNHLKYAYLRENDTLPVVISAQTNAAEEKLLLNMLKRHKKGIGWTLQKFKE